MDLKHPKNKKLIESLQVILEGQEQTKQKDPNNKGDNPGSRTNMTHLSFSLSPAALVRLHDALICLAKFNESVSIEAEYDLVRLFPCTEEIRHV